MDGIGRTDKCSAGPNQTRLPLKRDGGNMDSSESHVTAFTIPRKIRSAALLLELPIASREFQHEIRCTIEKSYRHPQSLKRFSFQGARSVHNEQFEEEYQERRRELRQEGYTEKELADSYAFLHADTEEEVARVCREGAMVNNCQSECLGDPRMGVQLCRHADILKPTQLQPGSTGYLIVFRIIKGRVKAVFENHGGVCLEPTPNFDCHVSKNNLADKTFTPQQLFESTQIYLYEYGDLSAEERPRQVCPIAVIRYRIKKVQQTDLTGSPRVATVVSKSPSQGGSKAEQQEYIVWSGVLSVKGLFACPVQMLHTGGIDKPIRLGSCMNISHKVGLREGQEKYLRSMSALLRQTEVFNNGWYINVCQLKPVQAKSNFEKVKNYLGKSESMAVLKLEDGVLLLMTDSEITYQLGLTKPHQYDAGLHCLFLSKESRRPKKPFYSRSSNILDSEINTLLQNRTDAPAKPQQSLPMFPNSASQTSSTYLPPPAAATGNVSPAEPVQPLGFQHPAQLLNRSPYHSPSQPPPVPPPVSPGFQNSPQSLPRSPYQSSPQPQAVPPPAPPHTYQTSPQHWIPSGTPQQFQSPNTKSNMDPRLDTGKSPNAAWVRGHDLPLSAYNSILGNELPSSVSLPRLHIPPPQGFSDLSGASPGGQSPRHHVGQGPQSPHVPGARPAMHLGLPQVVPGLAHSPYSSRQYPPPFPATPPPPPPTHLAPPPPRSLSHGTHSQGVMVPLRPEFLTSPPPQAGPPHSPNADAVLSHNAVPFPVPAGQHFRPGFYRSMSVPDNMKSYPEPPIPHRVVKPPDAQSVDTSLVSGPPASSLLKLEKVKEYFKSPKQKDPRKATPAVKPIERSNSVSSDLALDSYEPISPASDPETDSPCKLVEDSSVVDVDNAHIKSEDSSTINNGVGMKKIKTCHDESDVSHHRHRNPSDTSTALDTIPVKNELRKKSRTSGVTKPYKKTAKRHSSCPVIKSPEKVSGSLDNDKQSHSLFPKQKPVIAQDVGTEKDSKSNRKSAAADANDMKAILNMTLERDLHRKIEAAEKKKAIAEKLRSIARRSSIAGEIVSRDSKAPSHSLEPAGRSSQTVVQVRQTSPTKQSSDNVSQAACEGQNTCAVSPEMCHTAPSSVLATDKTELKVSQPEPELVIQSAELTSTVLDSTEGGGDKQRLEQSAAGAGGKLVATTGQQGAKHSALNKDTSSSDRDGDGSKVSQQGVLVVPVTSVPEDLASAGTSLSCDTTSEINSSDGMSATTAAAGCDSTCSMEKLDDVASTSAPFDKCAGNLSNKVSDEGSTSPEFLQGGTAHTKSEVKNRTVCRKEITVEGSRKRRWDQMKKAGEKQEGDTKKVKVEYRIGTKKRRKYAKQEKKKSRRTDKPTVFACKQEAAEKALSSLKMGISRSEVKLLGRIPKKGKTSLSSKLTLAAGKKPDTGSQPAPSAVKPTTGTKCMPSHSADGHIQEPRLGSELSVSPVGDQQEVPGAIAQESLVKAEESSVPTQQGREVCDDVSMSDASTAIAERDGTSLSGNRTEDLESHTELTLPSKVQVGKAASSFSSPDLKSKVKSLSALVEEARRRKCYVKLAREIKQEPRERPKVDGDSERKDESAVAVASSAASEVVMESSRLRDIDVLDGENRHFKPESCLCHSPLAKTKAGKLSRSSADPASCQHGGSYGQDQGLGLGRMLSDEQLLCKPPAPEEAKDSFFDSVLETGRGLKDAIPGFDHCTTRGEDSAKEQATSDRLDEADAGEDVEMEEKETRTVVKLKSALKCCVTGYHRSRGKQNKRKDTTDIIRYVLHSTNSAPAVRRSLATVTMENTVNCILHQPHSRPAARTVSGSKALVVHLSLWDSSTPDQDKLDHALNAWLPDKQLRAGVHAPHSEIGRDQTATATVVEGRSNQKQDKTASLGKQLVPATAHMSSRHSKDAKPVEAVCDSKLSEIKKRTLTETARHSGRLEDASGLGHRVGTEVPAGVKESSVDNSNVSAVQDSVGNKRLPGPGEESRAHTNIVSARHPCVRTDDVSGLAEESHSEREAVMDVSSNAWTVASSSTGKEQALQHENLQCSAIRAKRTENSSPINTSNSSELWDVAVGSKSSVTKGPESTLRFSFGKIFAAEDKLRPPVQPPPGDTTRTTDWSGHRRPSEVLTDGLRNIETITTLREEIPDPDSGHNHYYANKVLIPVGQQESGRMLSKENRMLSKETNIAVGSEAEVNPNQVNTVLQYQDQSTPAQPAAEQFHSFSCQRLDVGPSGDAGKSEGAVPKSNLSDGKLLDKGLSALETKELEVSKPADATTISFSRSEGRVSADSRKIPKKGRISADIRMSVRDRVSEERSSAEVKFSDTDRIRDRDAAERRATKNDSKEVSGDCRSHSHSRVVVKRSSSESVMSDEMPAAPTKRSSSHHRKSEEKVSTVSGKKTDEKTSADSRRSFMDGRKSEERSSADNRRSSAGRKRSEERVSDDTRRSTDRRKSEERSSSSAENRKSSTDRKKLDEREHVSLDTRRASTDRRKSEERSSTDGRRSSTDRKISGERVSADMRRSSADRRKSEERSSADNRPSTDRKKSEERLFADNRYSADRKKSEERVSVDLRRASTDGRKSEERVCADSRRASTDHRKSEERVCADSTRRASTDHRKLTGRESGDNRPPSLDDKKSEESLIHSRGGSKERKGELEDKMLPDLRTVLDRNKSSQAGLSSDKTDSKQSPSTENEASTSSLKTVKEKGDARQSRQYHPYRKETKEPKRNVPTWSFDMAYGDLNDLLQNLTANTFRELNRVPVPVPCQSEKPLNKTGRRKWNAKNLRFADFHFERADVPRSPKHPRSLSGRTEEVPIVPDVIPDFEERGRQADLLEKVFCETEEEEVFGAEETVYNTEKDDETSSEKVNMKPQESTGVDSVKTEERAPGILERLKGPDVPLLIPGGPRTSRYSSTHLDSDNEDSMEILGADSSRKVILTEKPYQGPTGTSSLVSSTSVRDSGTVRGAEAERSDKVQNCESKQEAIGVKTGEKEQSIKLTSYVGKRIRASSQDSFSSVSPVKSPRKAGKSSTLGVLSESDTCLDWEDEEAALDHDPDALVLGAVNVSLVVLDSIGESDSEVASLPDSTRARTDSESCDGGAVESFAVAVPAVGCSAVETETNQSPCNDTVTVTSSDNQSTDMASASPDCQPGDKSTTLFPSSDKDMPVVDRESTVKHPEKCSATQSDIPVLTESDAGTFKDDFFMHSCDSDGKTGARSEHQCDVDKDTEENILEETFDDKTAVDVQVDLMKVNSGSVLPLVIGEDEEASAGENRTEVGTSGKSEATKELYFEVDGNDNTTEGQGACVTSEEAISDGQPENSSNHSFGVDIKAESVDERSPKQFHNKALPNSSEHTVQQSVDEIDAEELNGKVQTEVSDATERPEDRKELSDVLEIPIETYEEVIELSSEEDTAPPESPKSAEHQIAVPAIHNNHTDQTSANVWTSKLLNEIPQEVEAGELVTETTVGEDVAVLLNQPIKDEVPMPDLGTTEFWHTEHGQSVTIHREVHHDETSIESTVYCETFVPNQTDHYHELHEQDEDSSEVAIACRIISSDDFDSSNSSHCDAACSRQQFPENNVLHCRKDDEDSLEETAIACQMISQDCVSCNENLSGTSNALCLSEVSQETEDRDNIGNMSDWHDNTSHTNQTEIECSVVDVHVPEGEELKEIAESPRNLTTTSILPESSDVYPDVEDDLRKLGTVTDDPVCVDQSSHSRTDIGKFSCITILEDSEEQFPLEMGTSSVPGGDKGSVTDISQGTAAPGSGKLSSWVTIETEKVSKNTGNSSVDLRKLLDKCEKDFSWLEDENPLDKNAAHCSGGSSKDSKIELQKGANADIEMFTDQSQSENDMSGMEEDTTEARCTDSPSDVIGIINSGLDSPQSGSGFESHGHVEDVGETLTWPAGDEEQAIYRTISVWPQGQLAESEADQLVSDDGDDDDDNDDDADDDDMEKASETASVEYNQPSMSYLEDLCNKDQEFVERLPDTSVPGDNDSQLPSMSSHPPTSAESGSVMGTPVSYSSSCIYEQQQQYPSGYSADANVQETPAVHTLSSQAFQGMYPRLPSQTVPHYPQMSIASPPPLSALNLPVWGANSQMYRHMLPYWYQANNPALQMYTGNSSSFRSPHPFTAFPGSLPYASQPRGWFQPCASISPQLYAQAVSNYSRLSRNTNMTNQGMNSYNTLARSHQSPFMPDQQTAPSWMFSGDRVSPSDSTPDTFYLVEYTCEFLQPGAGGETEATQKMKETSVAKAARVADQGKDDPEKKTAQRSECRKTSILENTSILGKEKDQPLQLKARTENIDTGEEWKCLSRETQSTCADELAHQKRQAETTRDVVPSGNSNECSVQDLLFSSGEDLDNDRKEPSIKTRQAVVPPVLPSQEKQLINDKAARSYLDNPSNCSAMDLLKYDTESIKFSKLKPYPKPRENLQIEEQPKKTGYMTPRLEKLSNKLSQKFKSRQTKAFSRQDSSCKLIDPLVSSTSKLVKEKDSVTDSAMEAENGKDTKAAVKSECQLNEAILTFYQEINDLLDKTDSDGESTLKEKTAPEENMRPKKSTIGTGSEEDKKKMPELLGTVKQTVNTDKSKTECDTMKDKEENSDILKDTVGRNLKIGEVKKLMDLCQQAVDKVQSEKGRRMHSQSLAVSVEPPDGSSDRTFREDLTPTDITVESESTSSSKPEVPSLALEDVLSGRKTEECRQTGKQTGGTNTGVAQEQREDECRLRHCEKDIETCDATRSRLHEASGSGTEFPNQPDSGKPEEQQRPGASDHKATVLNSPLAALKAHQFVSKSEESCGEGGAEVRKGTKGTAKTEAKLNEELLTFYKEINALPDITDCADETTFEGLNAAEQRKKPEKCKDCTDDAGEKRKAAEMSGCIRPIAGAEKSETESSIERGKEEKRDMKDGAERTPKLAEVKTPTKNRSEKDQRIQSESPCILSELPNGIKHRKSIQQLSPQNSTVKLEPAAHCKPQVMVEAVVPCRKGSQLTGDSNSDKVQEQGEDSCVLDGENNRPAPVVEEMEECSSYASTETSPNEELSLVDSKIQSVPMEAEEYQRPETMSPRSTVFPNPLAALKTYQYVSESEESCDESGVDDSTPAPGVSLPSPQQEEDTEEPTVPVVEQLLDSLVALKAYETLSTDDELSVSEDCVEDQDVHCVELSVIAHTELEMESEIPEVGSPCREDEESRPSICLSSPDENSLSSNTVGRFGITSNSENTPEGCSNNAGTKCHYLTAPIDTLQSSGTGVLDFDLKLKDSLTLASGNTERETVVSDSCCDSSTDTVNVEGARGSSRPDITLHDSPLGIGIGNTLMLLRFGSEGHKQSHDKSRDKSKREGQNNEVSFTTKQMPQTAVPQASEADGGNSLLSPRVEHAGGRSSSRSISRSLSRETSRSSSSESSSSRSGEPSELRSRCISDRLLMSSGTYGPSQDENNSLHREQQSSTSRDESAGFGLDQRFSYEDSYGQVVSKNLQLSSASFRRGRNFKARGRGRSRPKRYFQTSRVILTSKGCIIGKSGIKGKPPVSRFNRQSRSPSSTHENLNCRQTAEKATSKRVQQAMKLSSRRGSYSGTRSRSSGWKVYSRHNLRSRDGTYKGSVQYSSSRSVSSERSFSGTASSRSMSQSRGRSYKRTGSCSRRRSSSPARSYSSVSSSRSRSRSCDRANKRTSSYYTSRSRSRDRSNKRTASNSSSRSRSRGLSYKRSRAYSRSGSRSYSRSYTRTASYSTSSRSSSRGLSYKRSVFCSRSRSRSYSRSCKRTASYSRSRSRSRGLSYKRTRSYSRSRSRSHSRSRSRSCGRSSMRTATCSRSRSSMSFSRSRSRSRNRSYKRGASCSRSRSRSQGRPCKRSASSFIPHAQSGGSSYRRTPSHSRSRSSSQDRWNKGSVSCSRSRSRSSGRPYKRTASSSRSRSRSRSGQRVWKRKVWLSEGSTKTQARSYQTATAYSRKRSGPRSRSRSGTRSRSRSGTRSRSITTYSQSTSVCSDRSYRRSISCTSGRSVSRGKSYKRLSSRSKNTVRLRHISCTGTSHSNRTRKDSVSSFGSDSSLSDSTLCSTDQPDTEQGKTTNPVQKKSSACQSSSLCSVSPASQSSSGSQLQFEPEDKGELKVNLVFLHSSVIASLTSGPLERLLRLLDLHCSSLCRWKVCIHAHQKSKLVMKSRTSLDLQKMVDCLSYYQHYGIVEILPFHDCDRGQRTLLQCAEEKKTGAVHNSFLLTEETPNETGDRRDSPAVMSCDMETFLTSHLRH